MWGRINSWRQRTDKTRAVLDRRVAYACDQLESRILMSHFRGIGLSWTATPAKSLLGGLAQINIHVQQSFRLDYPWSVTPTVGAVIQNFDSIALDREEGGFSSVYSVDINVTSVDTANDWFTGYADVAIKLSPGTYDAGFDIGDSISTTLFNQHDQPIQTHIVIPVFSAAGGGSQAVGGPALNVPPLISINDTDTTLNLPLTDPTGQTTDPDRNGFHVIYSLSDPTGQIPDDEFNNIFGMTPGGALTYHAGYADFYNQGPVSGLIMLKVTSQETTGTSSSLLGSASEIFLLNVSQNGPLTYHTSTILVTPGNTIHYAPGQPMSFTAAALAYASPGQSPALTPAIHITSLTGFSTPAGMTFSTLTHTLSGANDIGSETASWTPAAAESGTYNILLQAVDDNYGITQSTVTLAPYSSATLNVLDATGSYTGNPFNALATINGANILEGVGIAINYVNTDTNVDLGVNAPIHPGHYQVTASFAGSTNYLPTRATTPFQIIPAQASILITGYEIPYDGALHAATGSAIGVNTENLSNDLSLPGNVSVGSYIDTWKFHDPDGNYLDASGTTLDTIEAVKPAIALIDVSGTYTGNPFAATATINDAGTLEAEGLTLDYINTDTSADLGAAAPAHTGNYKVTAKFNGSADYLGATATALFAITPATPSILVSGYTVVYDGAQHVSTVSAIGVKGESLVTNVALQGTAHAIAGATIDPWSFHDPNGNYADASGTVNDTISRAIPTVQVANAGGTYKGSSFGATSSVAGITNVFAQALESIGLTLDYINTTSTADLGATAPIDAGTYKVVATFPGSLDYSAVSVSAPFAISSAATSLQISSSTGGVSIPGQSVSFNAIVVALPPGAGTPVGSVQFFDNGVSLGSVPLVAGSAALTTSALVSGSHSVSATFVPTSGNFTASTASLVQGIAGSSVASNALYLLDSSGKGALTLSGSADVTVSGGTIVVDSNNTKAIVVSGAALVQAGATDVVGGISASGSAMVQHAATGHAALADPLAVLPVPNTATLPLRSSSTLHIAGTSVVTLQPGVYIGGISIAGSAVVALSPGIYYLQGGGFNVSGAAIVKGQGVLLYNAAVTAADQITLSGSGVVTLSPATTGSYAGVAIFQARTATAAINLSGAAQLKATGIIYAASAVMTISGSALLNTFGSSVVIDDLTMSGAAELFV